MHRPHQRHPRRRHEQVLDGAEEAAAAEPENSRIDVHVDAEILRWRARCDEAGGLTVSAARGREFFATECAPTGGAAQAVADERVCFLLGRTTDARFICFGCRLTRLGERRRARRAPWRRRRCAEARARAHRRR